MAADSSSTTTDIPCPDPSVHSKQHKLSEQASTAALYVTHPERATNRGNVLNPDGKLSSKSAAASLKYAKPHELPSFPSHGIDTANSAGQAAMIAKDYRMKELWQPELSSAGSRAALLAHKDGGKLDLWQPSASAEGNSAAKLAMLNKSLSPQLDYGYTKDGRSNALLAATKSQRNGRQRSGSTPAAPVPEYPDSANSAYNALNAATVSHRASVKSPATGREPDGWDSPAMQAARIQNIGDHIDREMYTEKPPVEIEQQEKRDQAALRASAISMAKQMYEHQHRTTLGDAPNLEASNARTVASTTPQTDIKQEALRYIHLQDAAHKLAQERLAKVDKNFEAMRYREYYGYSSPQRKSLRPFGRKRASSEAAKDELDSDDEEQAQRVRNQMSQFNSALATVDSKKQQSDRDALLAAAQKRVQKSMLDMDEKVFQDTGKVSQAMMDEWETKARKRAAEDAEKREANRGKTHIGAGKYMDTAEIEAIAQARLKPTLDEINDNAEKRRARDEEIRLDRAEQERHKREEKARQKEIKDEQKRSKQEDKIAAKQEKEERKAAEKEEPETKRGGLLSKLSVKRKSRETSKTEAAEAAAVPAATTTVVAAEPEPTPATATTEPVITSPETTTAPPTTTASEPAAPVVATETPSVKKESIEDDHHTARAALPVFSRPSKTTDAEHDDGDKPKGVKGFFSKLRHRQSKTETKEAEPATSTAKTTTATPEVTAVTGPAALADEQHEEADVEPKPVVADSVTEPPSLPEHVGTDGVIGDAHRVSGIGGEPGASSPSSFRRHDAGEDADVSSLSSSGLEEADLHGGRTGRVARLLGLSRKDKTHDTEPAKETVKAEPVAAAPAVVETPSKDVDDDADDAFEEARDTVDPETAPEPSFTGQKATTNARETKFQEEL